MSWSTFRPGWRRVRRRPHLRKRKGAPGTTTRPKGAAGRLSEADPDGLVALVNAAHACGSIPTSGGLPVSVSVTLESTVLGDQVWTTSRGHTLTDAEARFSACDASRPAAFTVSPGREARCFLHGGAA